jgi:peptide/nickel transport system ATP-binding protein
MLDLKERLGTAIVLITHDLGVIAETAQRAVVMYAGRKVEEASVEALFERPRHPYTLGLMKSVPRLDKAAFDVERRRLAEIPGMVPALKKIPPGCIFAPRCAFAVERCRREAPPLEEHAPGHWSACWEEARVAAVVTHG